MKGNFQITPLYFASGKRATYCFERTFAFDQSPVGTKESSRNIEGKTSDNESEGQTRDEVNIQQIDNFPLDHSDERSAFADPVIFPKIETRVEALMDSFLSDTSLDNPDGYEEKNTPARGSPSSSDEKNDFEHVARVKQNHYFNRSLFQISGLCDLTDGVKTKEKEDELLDSKQMIRSEIGDSARADPVIYSTQEILIVSPRYLIDDVKESLHQAKPSQFIGYENSAQSSNKNDDMDFSQRVNLSPHDESEKGLCSQLSGSTDNDGLSINTTEEPNGASFSSNSSMEYSQSKDAVTLEESLRDATQLKLNTADLSDDIVIVNKTKYESQSNHDAQSEQSPSSEDLDTSQWKSIHADYSNNPSDSSTIIKSDEPSKYISKSGRKTAISFKDVTEPIDATNQDNHCDLTSAKRPIDTTSGLELWRGAAHRRKLEVIQSQFHVTEPRLSSFKFAQFDNHSATRLRKTFLTTKPKKFPPEEDPYRPFKAKSLPNNSTGGVAGVPKVEKRSVTQPKSPQLGSRRKPDETSQKKEPPNTKQYQSRRASDFPTHPPPKKSLPIIKKKALEAEPFTRVLSGSEASEAKERARQERIEREKDEARRLSTFRALPLPSMLSRRNSERQFEQSPQHDLQSSPLLGLDFVDSKQKNPRLNTEELYEQEATSFQSGLPKQESKRRHTFVQLTSSKPGHQTLGNKENQQGQKSTQRRSLINALETELNDLRKSLR